MRLLHEENVEDFIKRDGFGMSRTPPPGPRMVVVEERALIDFDKAPPLSALYELASRKPLPADDARTADYLALKLPTRESLSEFHVHSRGRFAMPYRFGHVKDIDHVAGFVPHGFDYGLWTPADDASEPPSDEAQRRGEEQKRWRVVRLELMSLLKHEKPAVYVSEHLPRMDELIEAKTRPLTAFEAGSLTKLQAGEDVLAQTSGNLIEMVGAVRASKNCMQCHEVPHGALLGAFSYQLQRDPPIPISSIDE
jgi:hypothetical protein